jgi:hypothetical protein
MRSPTVQGARVTTALAELLESNVALPSEEGDVLQVWHAACVLSRRPLSCDLFHRRYVSPQSFINLNKEC